MLFHRGLLVSRSKASPSAVGVLHAQDPLQSVEDCVEIERARVVLQEHANGDGRIVDVWTQTVAVFKGKPASFDVAA